MAIYTDSVEFASPYLPPAAAGRLCSVRDPEPSIQPVLDGIFGASAEIFGAAAPESRWAEILLTPFSPRSQFNVLVGMARSGAALPDRVACLAGSGLEFHGFKGRSWEASEGNVHLSVHLAPERPVERFEVAFTILAAVAVVEALDGIPGLAACPRIRWVNDILLGQGKVAGVLAYSKTLRNHVSSVVLGIGVNVETTPSVRPTPFVPSVTSVREFLPADAPDARVTVLTRLLAALDDNYRLLLTEGYRPLLERYRERSVVVGREVTVPPLIMEDRYCDMPEEQEKRYEMEKSAVRNEILRRVETEDSADTNVAVLRALTRLRQIANHPALVDPDYPGGSGKFEEVIRNLVILREEGHKVLIFSSFVKHLNLFASRFAAEGTAYSLLTGASTHRDRIINQFRNDPENRFFLISLKAGGTGLNLTEASYVVLLDPWWNPAAELQAIHRAHRIGQDKKVIAFKFITENTIEEKMLKLQQRKQLLSDAFIPAGNPLKNLTREELQELFG